MYYNERCRCNRAGDAIIVNGHLDYTIFSTPAMAKSRPLKQRDVHSCCTRTDTKVTMQNAILLQRDARFYHSGRHGLIQHGVNSFDSNHAISIRCNNPFNYNMTHAYLSERPLIMQHADSVVAA